MPDHATGTSVCPECGVLGGHTWQCGRANASSNSAKREQLLDDTAKVALALQFATQHTPDGHEAFLRILELVPADLRGKADAIPNSAALESSVEGTGGGPTKGGSRASSQDEEPSGTVGSTPTAFHRGTDATRNRVYEWEYRNLEGEVVCVRCTETMEPPDKSGWYLRMPKRVMQKMAVDG